MANLIGRSESWLSQVERGIRSVDRLPVLMDLAQVLKVDVEALLGRPWKFVVPPESWRACLCGFPVGGRGVLVVDRAHHADRAVPSVVVVEPVAPVQHNGLRLSGVTELVA